jgi:hypothetical protein
VAIHKPLLRGNPVLFWCQSLLTAVFHTHTEPLSLAVAMLPEPSAVHTRSRIAPSWLSITGATRPLPAATLQAAAQGTQKHEMQLTLRHQLPDLPGQQVLAAAGAIAHDMWQAL